MSDLEDRLTAALTITADTVKEETLRPLAFPSRTRRRWLLALTPVAAAMAVVLIVGIEVGIGHLGTFTPPARAGLAAPTVSIGKDPAALAFDAADRTIYVLGGRPSPGLTMVGTGDCNATTTSGCRTRTLIHVPPGAVGLAVNPRNDTIYVIYNNVGQLSVINGQPCNAANTSGCAAAVATQAAPALAAFFPDVTVDPVTDTLYYGTSRGLAVIDGRTCYGQDVLGCGKVLATVPAEESAGLVVNQATGTLYGMLPGVGAVTVINRDTCDAVTTTGCASPATVIRGGPIPVDGAADPTANTIYFAGGGSSVFMVDASACRAGNLNRYQDAPPAFPVGAGPGHLALDPAAHTLYVANVAAGTLSIINTATCNADEVRGCPRTSGAGTGRSAPAAHHNPTYWCDSSVTMYDSGLPAGPLITGSVRVAAGTVDGLPWSLWAKKGVRDPFGIEQGGVVVNGRWYGLCEVELSDGANGNFEMIAAGAHGIAYGWAQHPQNVRFALTSTSPGRLPAPSSVHLNGLTFFITRLPESACAYRSITLHAVATKGPAWGGVENRINGACMPNRLVPMGNGGGAATWGRGVNAWATP